MACGLAAHPETARLRPRNDIAATAKTRSVRVTAKHIYMTIREVIFTPVTNMGTP